MSIFIADIQIECVTIATGEPRTLVHHFLGVDYTSDKAIRRADKHLTDWAKNSKYLQSIEIQGITIKNEF